MIKIENADLDNIAADYFELIKNPIMERAAFYKNVLRTVFNQHDPLLLNTGPVHWKTRRRAINNLLAAKMPTKNNSANDYQLIRRNNLLPWVVDKEDAFENVLDFLSTEQNLREILLAQPLDTITIDEDLKVIFNVGADAGFYSCLHTIIDYGLFDQYAYMIASKIGINTCPYCNRNYINTVIDAGQREIIRPTFDHFFPKSKHPFLGLSFFNLIPSCYYCNSNLKTAVSITHDTHLHPYLDGFGDACKFGVLIKDNYPSKSDPRNYKIFLLPGVHPQSKKYRQIFGSQAGEGNTALFEIASIYNSHCDIVGELVVRADKYSTSQSDSLKMFFGELSSNPTEFYQFYFGNYVSEKNFNRRPLAKLTKDILQQLLPKFFKANGIVV